MENEGTRKAIIANDAIVCYMRPYTTPYQALIAGMVNEILGDNAQYMENFHTVFVLFESYVIDVEFITVDNEHVAGFRTYWEQHAESDIAGNWGRFIRLVSVDMMYELFDAYEETRGDNLPKAPDIIQAGKPDPKETRKASSNGGEPSVKSRKRQKATPPA